MNRISDRGAVVEEQIQTTAALETELGFWHIQSKWVQGVPLEPAEAQYVEERINSVLSNPLVTRSRWPVDGCVWVRLREPWWLSGWFSRRLVIQSSRGDVICDQPIYSVVLKPWYAERSWWDYTYEVDRSWFSPDGTLEVEARLYEDCLGRHIIGRARSTLTIQDASLPEILHPLWDDGLRRAIESRTRVGIDQDGQVYIDMPRFDAPEGCSVAVELSIVNAKGEEQGHTSLYWIDAEPFASGVYGPSFGTTACRHVEMKWNPNVKPRQIGPNNASVRICGSPTLALRDFGATHYWDGTIEVPLRSLQSTEPTLRCRELRAP